MSPSSPPAGRGSATRVTLDLDTPIDVTISATGDASVGDLLPCLSQASGSEWGEELWIEARSFPTDTPLTELPLHDGAILSPSPPPGPAPAVVELRGVAGDRSGEHLRLRPGSYGFEAAAAPVISVDESGLVTIAPSVVLTVNGSPRSGPCVLVQDDVVQLDSTAWQVARPDPHPLPVRPNVFGRPPRTLPPELPEPIDAPNRDRVHPPSRSFRIAMVIAPLLMGATMVFVFQRWFYAIFMLMSPVVLAINFVDDRLRRRKGSRRAEAAFRKSLHEFEASLRSWRAQLRWVEGRRHPDLACLVRRALEHDDKLWERRPGHADFLQLVAGYGDRPLASPIVAAHSPEPEVSEVINRPLPGGSLPIGVDFDAGRAIGLTGPATRSRAVARGLVVQAAVTHGPADLSVAVACPPSLAGEWSWVGWLPHTKTGQGRLRLATSQAEMELLLAGVRGSERNTMIVLDHWLTADQAGLVANLLAAGATLLVLAPVARELPSAVATIIQTTPGAGLVIGEPSTGRFLDDITGIFVARSVAEAAARALTGLTDPEHRAVGAGLPDGVGLLELLDLTEPTPQAVAAAWAEGGRTIRAPIGMTESGVLEIDLVEDGPHGLLAGTTGSGKSELLRTLVASLAARVDPETLNFVLIDYKGGSAFDVCADLPHVTGLVTDLDAHLSRRALTCLEAELEYRERRLRDVGASDLPAYVDLGCEEPLPRLLIVIDEFAAMAKDMPDFMDALVDIAARGRSLGVHLLLATQRPAGVIKDNIRANTNLRIALRVQDVADSKDVIGDGCAAALTRSRPGRGYIRFGPSELTGFQTALVTGHSSVAEPAVHVNRIRFGPDQDVPVPAGGVGEGTDLSRLVRAIREAALATGMRPPRTPWPAPLDPQLALHTLLPSSQGLALGVADEPAAQRLRPHVWLPDDGNLALYGMAGSGAEAAAETAIRSIAASYSPDEAHVFILGFGTHHFASASTLDHVAEPVGPDDIEQCEGLLRMLDREIQERRREPSLVADRPRLFLVVEDAGGLRKTLEPFQLAPLLDIFGDILAYGPALGIHTIITAYRAAALPLRMSGLFVDRLVFAFADPAEAAAFGFSARDIPALPFGGALDARSRLVVQIATRLDGVPVHEGPATGPRPAIPVLPSSVSSEDLGAVEILETGWRAPVGIGGPEVGSLWLEFEEGDHLAVVGPNRSGKSTALAMLAEKLAGGSDHQLVAITPRRSPLRDLDFFKYRVSDMGQVDDLARGLAGADTTVVVFVDDAEMVTAAGLDELLAFRRPKLHFVIGVRSGDASRLYGHWSRRVRKSRKGLVLQPEAGDGELFGAKLPRSQQPGPPGRGYLIDRGTVRSIQVARREVVDA